MLGIFNYTPETNQVSRVYNVAAILCLKCMTHVMFFLMMNALNFYISAFRCMCTVPIMAVYCSSLISFFPTMLLTYCLNDFQMVPFASVITGVTFVLNSTFAVFLP